jgi:hypothetical protein
MTSGRSKPAVEEEAARCGSSRAASGQTLPTRLYDQASVPFDVLSGRGVADLEP